MFSRSRGLTLVRPSVAAEVLESRVLMSAAPSFVIHVSVDGLRPDVVTELGQSGLPNFHRLRQEGAFTDNARTDYDYSITLPNHTSQVTGRAVVGPAGHNWVTNSDPAATNTLHSNKRSYVASAWDVAHDAGLRTGLFASKTKFSLYDQSYDADEASLQGGAAHPNGRDKISVAAITETDSVAMTDVFLREMGTSALHYALVHFDDPDTAGHASGWMGSSYLSAVRAVDAQLGRIFSLLDTDADLAGRTAIVLTADHGGEGADHSDAADPQSYTIPFYAWGAGVTPGGDLYRMNSATRSDPRTGRPDYGATPQPIRNGDAANLALDLLGLGPVAGSTINLAQDLAVDVVSPPPPPPPLALSFRQGVGGYAGTVDTQVQQATPSTGYGSATLVTVDSDEPPGTNNDSQGLLSFDVFGNDAGRIPAGSEIVSARLELSVAEQGARVELHRMLRAWSAADTWASLGGGVSADGVEAVAAADAAFTPSSVGTHSVDVTASLAAWSAGAGPNFGWAVLPTGTDGVDYHTAEGASPPKLVVEYYPPADLPTVSVANTSAGPVGEPAGAGQFTVTRTGDTTLPLVVAYAVSGTATAGADYSPLAGTVEIPAGEASAVINVAVLDDAHYEGGETLVVTLSAGADYRVTAPAAATVAIADDETPPPVVTIAAADALAAEAGLDAGVFRVDRSGDTGAPLTVTYTVGGTASAGTDYAALSGTVTIPANEAFATFSVVPFDDTAYEPDETVVVTLGAGAGYDLGTAKAATIVVRSDDVQPVAPAAPTELTGRALNGGRIDLSWKDNSANETSFVLEWSRDGKTWTTLDTLAAGTTTYSKTGLLKSTFYYFRVKAVNAYGSSAWTAVLKLRSAAK